MQDDTKTREQFRDVQEYRSLVLKYEALDAEIDALIMEHGGNREHMPDTVFEHYRELAHQRDEVQNEIREREQRLLGDI